MLILEAVLGAAHLLCSAGYYILLISYYTGRGIFSVLCQAWTWVRGVYTAVGIIGEEFYKFQSTLADNTITSLNNVRTTTNNGIGAVIDAITQFSINVWQIFINTKVYSKNVVISCEQIIISAVSILRCSLLLIADWLWWLLTIIPRTVICIFITISDFLVFSLGATTLLLSNLLRNIIDDFFRYTIAIMIIVILIKNIRRLCRLLGRYAAKIVQFLCIHLSSVANIFRTQRRNHHLAVTQLSDAEIRLHSSILPQRRRLLISRASPEEKLLESQRCVVCRDQAKCVLLLPCKHLCLCEECTSYMLRLEVRRAHCPLCRTEIKHTMSVYI